MLTSRHCVDIVMYMSKRKQKKASPSATAIYYPSQNIKDAIVEYARRAGHPSTSGFFIVTALAHMRANPVPGVDMPDEQKDQQQPPVTQDQVGETLANEKNTDHQHSDAEGAGPEKLPEPQSETAKETEASKEIGTEDPELVEEKAKPEPTAFNEVPAADPEANTVRRSNVIDD